MQREDAPVSFLESLLLERVLFYANGTRNRRFTSITLAKDCKLIDFNKQHTDGWGGSMRPHTLQKNGQFFQESIWRECDMDEAGRMLAVRISEYWRHYHQDPDYTGHCFVELGPDQASVGFLRNSPLPDGVEAQQPSISPT